MYIDEKEKKSCLYNFIEYLLEFLKIKKNFFFVFYIYN